MKSMQLNATAREVARQMTPDHPKNNGIGLDLDSADTMKLIDGYVNGSNGAFTYEELRAATVEVLERCGVSGFASLT